MKKILLLAVTAVLLAGCGSPAPAAAPTATTTAQLPTQTPSMTPSPTQAPITAITLAQKVRAAVPTVTGITEITEANDVNKLIGRPGQYTSGAWLADSAATPGVTGVDGGAVVEVFATAADAAARSAYIQGALKKMGPVAGTEYHYLKDSALLRVSGKLPPSVAAQYQAAFS